MRGRHESSKLLKMLMCSITKWRLGMKWRRIYLDARKKFCVSSRARLGRRNSIANQRDHRIIRGLFLQAEGQRGMAAWQLLVSW